MFSKSQYFLCRECRLFSISAGGLKEVLHEGSDMRNSRKGELRYAENLLATFSSAGLAFDRGFVVVGDARSDWLLFRNLETLAEKHGFQMPIGLFYDTDDFFASVQRSNGAYFFRHWDDLAGHIMQNLCSTGRAFAVDVQQTLLFPRGSAGSAHKTMHDATLLSFVRKFYLGDAEDVKLDDLISIENEALRPSSFLNDQGDSVCYNNAEAHSIVTLMVCAGLINDSWLNRDFHRSPSLISILSDGLRSIENGGWVFERMGTHESGERFWAAEKLWDVLDFALNKAGIFDPLICPAYRDVERTMIRRGLGSGNDRLNTKLLKALSGVLLSPVVFVTDKPSVSLQGTDGFVFEV